jgi:hypothetical protein
LPTRCASRHPESRRRDLLPGAPCVGSGGRLRSTGGHALSIPEPRRSRPSADGPEKSGAREAGGPGWLVLLPGEAALRGARWAIGAAAVGFWILLWRTLVHPTHPLWLHAAFALLGGTALAAAVALSRSIASGRRPGSPIGSCLAALPLLACALGFTEIAAHRLGPEARWIAWVAFAVSGSAGLWLGELNDERTRAGRGARLCLSGGLAAACGAVAWVFFVPTGSIGHTTPVRSPAPALERAVPRGDEAADAAPERIDYAPEGASAPVEGLVSRTVDARPLLGGWSGFSGWLRTRTFGFGPEALPLAGSAWLPRRSDAGPAPLVLVVHGNHPMEVDSHEGFAYLCEALARHGYVCASVDLRFLNTSHVADAFGGLEGDRIVRSWMLLEHLALWRQWSETPGHPLEGRVDLGDIALVGHSRGGAAVVQAAEWNARRRIPAAPEVVLPRAFGIRSVTGLAPIEVATPEGVETAPPTLDGISYLVVHGGRDADVRSFEGALQYDRTRVAGSDSALKVSLLLERGNHNHFNTRWQPGDKPLLLAPLVERSGVLHGAVQRAFTTIAVRSFLDAVHRGAPIDERWLRDPEALLTRLGGLSVLHRFRDAATVEIAGFEEDDDPATTTATGGTLSIAGASVAREEQLERRWAGSLAPAHALRLAWERSPGDPTPRIALRLPEQVSTLGERDLLLLDLAIDPLDERAPGRIALTVELEDARGRRARAPVAAVGPADRDAANALYHAPLLNPRPEILFRTHAIGLADFARVDPGFDPARLREVRLLLDRTRRGTLLIDGIGLRRGGPGGSRGA